jgi:cytochrome c oxidase cbb3-type subunit 3
MPPFATALGDASNVTATACTCRAGRPEGGSATRSHRRRPLLRHLRRLPRRRGQGQSGDRLGRPTDDYWLYGNRVEDILAAIEKGHDGHMPAHRQILGETRARLVGAYVWSLSHPARGAPPSRRRAPAAR